MMLNDFKLTNDGDVLIIDNDFDFDDEVMHHVKIITAQKKGEDIFNPTSGVNAIDYMNSQTPRIVVARNIREELFKAGIIATTLLVAENIEVNGKYKDA